MVVIRVLVFTLGLLLVAGVLMSALKTLVLPRPSRSVLTATAFRLVLAVAELAARTRRTYEEQDRIRAVVGPIGLILIVFVWLTTVLAAFGALFWAVDPTAGVGAAYHLSGSSITTLGFAPADGATERTLAFVEAGLGLLLLTLLITYLPSIYGAFSRREMRVALLAVRAGTPPSATELLERYRRIDWMERLPGEWLAWEEWFVDIEESHTTYPVLAFFRSHDPAMSWITAAGAVLDAAALWVAAVADVPRAPGGIMIRAGTLSLRHIAEFFGIPFDPDPAPTDPISITREEFDAACEALEAVGVRLVADRDRAWGDFAGWRVNYDTVLLAIAEMIHAPYAPWTSDRSAPDHRRHPLARVWTPWWRRSPPERSLQSDHDES